MTGNELCGAIFSPCRTWRYALWRRWSDADNELVVIGLNPSTADESKDDPTIRRCRRFARDWGHSGLVMLNLFAFRATLPEDMKAAEDPIGPENDRYILQFAAPGRTIAAWGVHGKFLRRDETIASKLDFLQCLGLTKDGFPRHPLYVPAATLPVSFRLPKPSIDK